MKKYLLALIVFLFMSIRLGQAQKPSPLILGLQRAEWDTSGNIIASANGEEKALKTNNSVNLVSLDIYFVVDKANFEQQANTVGRLPIMFKWFRFSSARLFVVNVNRDLADLRSAQLKDEQGRWVYHCRASQNVTKGTWVIKPVYANNDPVMIDGKECEFKITVQ
jgi:hypothetical protein